MSRLENLKRMRAEFDAEIAIEERRSRNLRSLDIATLALHNIIEAKTGAKKARAMARNALDDIEELTHEMHNAQDGAGK